MIRPTTHDDAAAVIALGVATEMFAADETGELTKVLTDYFERKLPEGHAWITDDHEGEVRGVAYYAPTPFANGVCELLMIAVSPDCQRQGRGVALLQHVENALRANDQRLLLVETSGLPSYERARAFYKKYGFEQEARIRDFYQVGEDKVVFRKVLIGN
ncbi:MAG: N-acetyltransferase [Roseiflexaceae bacterium]